jgi:hypothetical protein
LIDFKFMPYTMPSNDEHAERFGGESIDASQAEDDAFVAGALRYLDGDVPTEAGAASLEAALRARPAHREAFVRLCCQRAMLAEMPAGFASGDASSGDASPGERQASLARRQFNRSTPLARGALRMAIFSASVTAATFAVWWAEGRWRAATSAASPSAPPSATASTDPREAGASSRATASFEPEYIATRARTTNCRWAIGGAPQDALAATEGGSRLASREIRLTSGVAEIVFDQGTRIILEGPARFTPQSARGGFLRSGKLVAIVPSRADPFAVQTPGALAIDRGADFGVQVNDSEQCEFHVFAGAIDLHLRGESLLPADPLRVGANQAVRVANRAPGEAAPQAAPIACRAVDFVRSIEPVKLALPPSLVSYWNFDEQGGPAGDLVGRNDGALQGVARTRGLVGRGAIAFDDRPGQVVNVGSGDGALDFTDGMTIEALVVTRWDGLSNLDSTGLNYDEIFRKDDGQRRMLLALQRDDNRNGFADPPPTPNTAGKQGPVLSFGLNLGGEYRELDMPLDGKAGRPRLDQIADANPHHIAATYDVASGRKRIYIDGRLCMEHAYQAGTALSTGGPRPAAIGNAAGLPWEAFWGVIDEVAIYRAALPADEIARHWRRAQAGKCYFDAANQQSRPESVNAAPVNATAPHDAT